MPLKRFDPISSEGFGGMGPDGMYKRLGIPVFFMMDSNWALPERKFESPASFSSPKILWILGFLISVSTTMTRTPVWAIAIAVLITVVVFPSPGLGLVRRTFLGGLSEKERRTDVRMFR